MRIVLHVHLQPFTPNGRGGILIRQLGGVGLDRLDFNTRQFSTGDADRRLLLSLFAITDDSAS